jgi:hypothetical protein
MSREGKYSWVANTVEVMAERANAGVKWSVAEGWGSSYMNVD